MKDLHLPQASLHPPSHGDSGLADATRPNWVLLDFSAYIADRRNSTTATCMTKAKKEIQVTFFPAHPPQLSYFCVYCHGEELSRFAMEPKVIATDDDVVLLRVAYGSPNDLIFYGEYEYYIYRASGGTDGGALLELLPCPNPYVFYDEQVGILSRGTEYTVVVLRDDASAYFRGSSTPGLYDVCLLESEKKVWTTMVVFVPLDRQQASNGEEGFRHETSKVITIGGRPGTMAFVDLWRGIVLFDVLSGDPRLRYFTMPPERGPIPFWRGNCTPSVTRDIVVVNGCFKFVEFEDNSLVNDGWIAATWKKEVTSSQEDSWCPGYNLASRSIHVDHSSWLFELLPKLPGDEGKTSMIFQRLHTDHPALSLHNDDIIYLRTMVEHQGSKAWVIAVDMSNGTLQGVAEFGAERAHGTILTYTQCRISKHLIMAPDGAGSEGEVKRPGSPLLGSHPKKLLCWRGV